MTPFTQAQATSMFYQQPTQHLNAGQGQVAYRRIGQGPDLLMIHGWPVSGATFRHLLPILSQHLTCHVIDLVGAGDSRFDRTTKLSLRQHIESIRQLIDQLKLRDLFVLGHDSGGLLARHALASDPRLRGLLLLNTETLKLGWRFKQFILGAKLPGFAHALGWAAMRPKLRQSAALLGDCFCDRSLISGDFEALFLKPLSDDPDRRWAAGQLIKSFDQRLISELPQVHAKIAAPVSLIWGEHDPFFPVPWAQQMLASFHEAKLHIIPDAKLFCHEERPALVAETILREILS